MEDLERAAIAPQTELDVGFKPSEAAFYLFQSYLTEFGTEFNAQKACYWLWKAGESADESGDRMVENLASACAWRICLALDAIPVSLVKKLDICLTFAILRGYRTALEDAEDLIQKLKDPEKKALMRQKVDAAIYLARHLCGSLSVPAFLPHRLLKRFTLHDISTLEEELREELGSEYDACLHDTSHEYSERFTASGANLPGQNAIAGNPRNQAFNRIFINNRGHGLLHMAAAQGDLAALQYLVRTYDGDIDIPSQDCEETPLLCACRAGHLECARFLLSCGADPDGCRLGQESPLHWLCNFKEEEMEKIVQS